MSWRFARAASKGGTDSGTTEQEVAERSKSSSNAEMGKTTEDQSTQPADDFYEEAVLFTGSLAETVFANELTLDARNCAVLDSACSSTVCGQTWLDCYLDGLDEQDKSKVEYTEGEKMFRFGGGKQLESNGVYHIPAMLAGRTVTIRTDVVASEIPLLLSKDAMKRARVKLNIMDDTSEILGEKVVLNHTRSGHYCVPIVRASEQQYRGGDTAGVERAVAGTCKGYFPGRKSCIRAPWR
jgi:hypothetical protein